MLLSSDLTDKNFYDQFIDETLPMDLPTKTFIVKLSISKISANNRHT